MHICSSRCNSLLFVTIWGTNECGPRQRSLPLRPSSSPRGLKVGTRQTSSKASAFWILLTYFNYLEVSLFCVMSMFTLVLLYATKPNLYVCRTNLTVAQIVTSVILSSVLNYKSNAGKWIVFSCILTFFTKYPSLISCGSMAPLLCFCQLQLSSLFVWLLTAFPTQSTYSLTAPSVSICLCRNHKNTHMDTQAGSCAVGCVTMMCGQPASSPTWYY